MPGEIFVSGCDLRSFREERHGVVSHYSSLAALKYTLGDEYG